MYCTYQHSIVYFMDQISCCLFGSKLQKQWTFDFLERKCLFWFSCWIPNTNYCSQRPIIIFCNSAILCQNSTKIKIRRPTFWKWHFQNIILDALKNPFSIWLYLLFIDRYRILGVLTCGLKCFLEFQMRVKTKGGLIRRVNFMLYLLKG